MMVDLKSSWEKQDFLPHCYQEDDSKGVTDENLPTLKKLKVSVENDEIKEVEEDMELLEVNDCEVNDIIIKFQSKDVILSVSSPQSTSKNRRYTLRPQKKLEKTECDFSSTYNRKKNIPLPKNGYLETIFENPVLKNGSLTLLGKKKLKRYLSFDSFVTKAKLRHRKLKSKRLSKGKRKKNSCKVSIEEVKTKLKSLEHDEWMEVLE